MMSDLIVQLSGCQCVGTNYQMKIDASDVTYGTYLNDFARL